MIKSSNASKKDCLYIGFICLFIAVLFLIALSYILAVSLLNNRFEYIELPIVLFPVFLPAYFFSMCSYKLLWFAYKGKKSKYFFGIIEGLILGVTFGFLGLWAFYIMFSGNATSGRGGAGLVLFFVASYFLISSSLNRIGLTKR